MRKYSCLLLFVIAAAAFCQGQTETQTPNPEPEWKQHWLAVGPGETDGYEYTPKLSGGKFAGNCEFSLSQNERDAVLQITRMNNAGMLAERIAMHWNPELGMSSRETWELKSLESKSGAVIAAAPALAGIPGTTQLDFERGSMVFLKGPDMVPDCLEYFKPAAPPVLSKYINLITQWHGTEIYFSKSGCSLIVQNNTVVLNAYNSRVASGVVLKIQASEIASGNWKVDLPSWQFTNEEKYHQAAVQDLKKLGYQRESDYREDHEGASFQPPSLRLSYRWGRNDDVYYYQAKGPDLASGCLPYVPWLPEPARSAMLAIQRVYQSDSARFAYVDPRPAPTTNN